MCCCWCGTYMWTSESTNMHSCLSLLFYPSRRKPQEKVNRIQWFRETAPLLHPTKCGSTSVNWASVRSELLSTLPPRLYYSVLDPAPLSCTHSAEPTLEKHCPKVDRGPPGGLILAELFLSTVLAVPFTTQSQIVLISSWMCDSWACHISVTYWYCLT